MESSATTAESSRFGKYTLVARLATGGMAEIFLARLQGAAGFEKLVCIKRILPHLARDKQFVQMFLAEAQIAARISHPNVCQVFELGEIEGSYYIAMEYLEGVPLACFRRDDYYGAAPDPRLVAGIAVQACEGLHHAHQLRHGDGSVMDVVHRDISPQNLFVTADGIVKVLDFGIAKIQGGAVRTSTGALKGTYAYMAPEQLRGERVDRRTDVFALGIVMWETLARRHLFKRDTEFLTFQAITAEPIEDLCAIRPDVPASLASVILTALARDRDARFPTARMMGEAIAAAIQPLSGAAISEELVRAFPVELAEQAELIRVVRDGGTFDLEVERGPTVGHGADMVTTPISNLRPRDGVPQAISGLHPGGPHAGSGPHGAPQGSGPHGAGPHAGARPGGGSHGSGPHAGSGPHRVSGAHAITAQPGTGAPSGMTAMPLPSGPSGMIAAQPGTGAPSGMIATPVTAAIRIQRSLRPLAIAALALGAGGIAAVIYARVVREPAHPVADGHAKVAPADRTEPAALTGPTAPPAAPAPVAAPAAPPANSAAAPGAAVPAAPSSPAAPTGAPAARSEGAGAPAAVPQVAAPPNPAAKAPTDKRSTSVPKSPTPPGKPAASSGPPGYITIDSSPVYATIYIDGKSYGETPLVRIELAPGRHQVHAVAPSGATRDVRITVEPGKVAPAARIVW